MAGEALHVLPAITETTVKGRPETMALPIRKIAVPMDFSPFSEAALEYAAVLAKGVKATVVLINVIDQRGLDRFIRFSGASHPNGERFKQGQSDDRRQRLQEMADKLEGRGIQTEAHLVVDVPFRGILSCISQSGCDLLVLVTKGRSNTADVLVGSCADKLFRRSPVPVVSLPPVYLERSKRIAHERPVSSRKVRSVGMRANKHPADSSDR